MKLSGYTIAKKCTDLNDIKEGIKEIMDYILEQEIKGKKIKKHAHIRLYKLYEKRKKWEE